VPTCALRCHRDVGTAGLLWRLGRSWCQVSSDHRPHPSPPPISGAGRASPRIAVPTPMRGCSGALHASASDDRCIAVAGPPGIGGRRGSMVTRAVRTRARWQRRTKRPLEERMIPPPVRPRLVLAERLADVDPLVLEHSDREVRAEAPRELRGGKRTATARSASGSSCASGRVTSSRMPCRSAGAKRTRGSTSLTTTRAWGAACASARAVRKSPPAPTSRMTRARRARSASCGGITSRCTLRGRGPRARSRRRSPGAARGTRPRSCGGASSGSRAC